MHVHPCPLELPISLVIPCGGDADSLAPLLSAVESGTGWPSEVLVVDASQQLLGRVRCAESFASRVRVLHSEVTLFPGAARNLGCQAASMKWIAFLDLNTLPSPHWLETLYTLSQRHPGVDLILGSTRYLGKSWQQRLFITATYGERPLATLPGSLVHHSVFSRLGGFLPCVRAGEDTDWLVRVKQFAIPHIPGSIVPLEYSAVPESLAGLIVKWFRNYRSCASVVFHLEAQKTVYVLGANLLVLLIAFNWNSLAADWQQTSTFYIANITKIVFSCILFGQILVRGLVMPLLRASAVEALLPVRWLFIGLLCVVLDFVKLLAFLLTCFQRSRLRTPLCRGA